MRDHDETEVVVVTHRRWAILPRMTAAGVRRARGTLAAALVVLALAGCADGSKARELQQSPLPLGGTWRAGLFVEGYGPQGLGPEVTATPSSSGGATTGADATLDDPMQTILAPLGLTAADVTNGYRVDLVEDGTDLMEPTLGFCAKDYPSEEAREARRRLVLVGPSGEKPGILSEAVLYTTPKAASQALDELRTATATCDASVPIDTGDATLTITQTPITGIDLSGFVAPGSRVVIASTLTNTTTSTAATLMTAYQVRGRALVALYFQNAEGQAFTDEQLAAFALLGQKFASRLGALEPAVADAG
jgi:hypothetical protein